jgi:hypothetical protein
MDLGRCILSYSPKQTFWKKKSTESLRSLYLKTADSRVIYYCFDNKKSFKNAQCCPYASRRALRTVTRSKIPGLLWINLHSPSTLCFRNAKLLNALV